MKDIILNRFSKIKEFAELDLIQQKKILTAFKLGYYFHKEEIWEVSFNEKINIWKNKVSIIRGEKDDLNLHRYGDFDLKQWFLRILEKPILEDSFVPLFNGYMKRLTPEQLLEI